MSNLYCGLTDAELERVRPDRSQLQVVRINHNTEIYIPLNKNPEQARKAFIEAWERDSKRHLDDETKFDFYTF